MQENVLVISCKMSPKIVEFSHLFGGILRQILHPSHRFLLKHSPTSLRVPQTRFGSVPGICRQRALVRSPDRWWVVGGGFIFPTTTSKVERYKERERRSACRIIPGIVNRLGSPLFISHQFRPFGREYITPVKKTY